MLRRGREGSLKETLFQSSEDLAVPEVSSGALEVALRRGESHVAGREPLELICVTRSQALLEALQSSRVS